MTLPKKMDVVVVGAGPTGLTLACTLRAANLDVLVLDKLPEGANTSRAAVIHAQTLEVLDELDVTPRLVAEGCVVPIFTVRDRQRVLARLDFSKLPTPFPYTLMLPQFRTEAILVERLAELDGHVQRPWTVTSVSDTPTGGVVTAMDENGASETVQARYVVGADGLNSVVRSSAGIGFSGDSYNASFVLADVQLDWPLPTDEVQLLLSPAGLVVVAPLPGGRHRIVATVDQAPETPSTDLIQSLLDERGPGGAHVNNLAWSSRFRVQHRIADAYRSGSLLLAGDAAHVHSPAGGQGMNTGIQDAVDLGHTLIDVLGGRAGETALDGYQQRRRPVAEQVVRLTDRATRMATLQGRVPRHGRNLALTVASRIPAVQRRLAMQIAELSNTRRPNQTPQPVDGPLHSSRSAGPQHHLHPADSQTQPTHADALPREESTDDHIELTRSAAQAGPPERPSSGGSF